MSTHHHVIRLLPWYVNGTLNEREMAAATTHLEDCADCRSTLEAVIEEARGLHEAADEARVAAIVAASGREFEALARNLHPPRAVVRSVPSRGLAAAAALLVVGLAIPAAWLARPIEPTVYELQTTRTASDAPVLQVVFKDGTSAEDIALLVRTSGMPLGPPSAHGVYRIALASDDPKALLERLRAHPAVRWAEIEL